VGGWPDPELKDVVCDYFVITYSKMATTTLKRAGNLPITWRTPRTWWRSFTKIIPIGHVSTKEEVDGARVWHKGLTKKWGFKERIFITPRYHVSRSPTPSIYQAFYRQPIAVFKRKDISRGLYMNTLSRRGLTLYYCTSKEGHWLHWCVWVVWRRIKRIMYQKAAAIPV